MPTLFRARSLRMWQRLMSYKCVGLRARRSSQRLRLLRAQRRRSRATASLLRGAVGGGRAARSLPLRLLLLCPLRPLRTHSVVD